MPQTETLAPPLETAGTQVLERPPVMEDVGISDIAIDRSWKVIVWDDPVNLAKYVVHVFRKIFGYSKKKAEKLVDEIQKKGKAVVSSGPKEKAESDVFRLHEYGLWATLEQDR